MIDLRGLDKAEVLLALYNASYGGGLGALYPDSKILTIEEARALLSRETDFDYIKGRVMHVNLRSDELDPWLYDEDHGTGAASRAIEPLLKRKADPEYPKIRLFKEIVAHQPTSSRFKGCKAFLPVMHREGDVEIPIVAEVEYQNPAYKPVPGKRFESHDEADLKAWHMNEEAGISTEVSWAVWESIKNADV